MLGPYDDDRIIRSSANKNYVFCSYRKVLAVEGFKCTMTWQRDKNFSSLSLQMCFLLLFIAFQVPIVHGKPLYIRSPNTKLLTKRCPYTQLLKRIPRCKVIQPRSFTSFLLHCNVAATCAYWTVWQPM